VQATDQYIGVRGSRVIVFDDDGVRAPVVASWLYQLGYESAVLAHGVNAAIKASAPPRTLPAHALPVLDANLLRALYAQAPDALRIDLRESAEYARGHAEGAAWSIRPRLPATLDRLGAAPDQPVILIASEPHVANLAGQDLLAAGYRHVYRLAEGYRTWQAAGLPEAAEPVGLPPEARIDYLFFVARPARRQQGRRARLPRPWKPGLDCAVRAG